MNCAQQRQHLLFNFSNEKMQRTDVTIRNATLADEKLESEQAAPYLVGYARVSTEEQSVDVQIDAMIRAGVHNKDIYFEKVSGTGKFPRLQLDLAIKCLRPGDRLVVWRLDRIARSMKELLARIEQIEAAGATFVSLTEAFDTKSAGGKFLVHILGAVAEFERQITSERTSAAMQAKKRQGVHVGRRKVMTEEKIEEALKGLRNGFSLGEVSTAIGVSVGSISKAIKVTRFKQADGSWNAIAELRT